MEQEPKGKVFPVHPSSIPPGALVILGSLWPWRLKKEDIIGMPLIWRHYLCCHAPSTNRNVDFLLLERVSAENWHQVDQPSPKAQVTTSVFFKAILEGGLSGYSVLLLANSSAYHYMPCYLLTKKRRNNICAIFSPCVVYLTIAGSIVCVKNSYYINFNRIWI
jgi:hypothetical protein